MVRRQAWTASVGAHPPSGVRLVAAGGGCPTCAIRRAGAAPGGRRERGLALIFVLWILTVLGAVALVLTFSTHLRMMATANLGDRTQAFFLARAGFERALADLAASRDRALGIDDLRDGAAHPYKAVQLGGGTWTLYAGPGPTGDDVYGLIDEAAYLDVNCASEEMLRNVPGMTARIAAVILSRRADGPITDLAELLGGTNPVDASVLYGEDQNRNGLLDANEDDGSATWPPDDADGRLDVGLSAYLTVGSAARNVTADGAKRADLNTASEEDLVKSIPGLTPQDALSVVEHRKKGKFESPLDLLEVELVERTAAGTGSEKPPKDEGPRPTEPGKPPPGAKEEKPAEPTKPAPSGEPGERPEPSRADGKPKSESPAGETAPPETSAAKTPSTARPTGAAPSVNVRRTGRKAFDSSRVRAMLDAVTVVDDEVQAGVVNLNTAPAEVLACLPAVTESLARDIVAWREARLPEPTASEAYDAGGPAFRSVADLLDIPGVTMDTLRQILPHVSVRSDVFRVRSFGVTRGGEVCCGVEGVIDRTGDACAVRAWRELD